MTNSQRTLSLAIRWTARILSLLSLGTLLLFGIGEGFNPLHFNSRELLLSLCFPLGVSIGMIIAWWREGPGGIITVLSVALFYVLNFILARRFPGGPFFLLFSLPGFLFLISWLYRRQPSAKL